MLLDFSDRTRTGIFGLISRCAFHSVCLKNRPLAANDQQDNIQRNWNNSICPSPLSLLASGKTSEYLTCCVTYVRSMEKCLNWYQIRIGACAVRVRVRACRSIRTVWRRGISFSSVTMPRKKNMIGKQEAISLQSGFLNLLDDDDGLKFIRKSRWGWNVLFVRRTILCEICAQTWERLKCSKKPTPEILTFLTGSKLAWVGFSEHLGQS